MLRFESNYFVKDVTLYNKFVLIFVSEKKPCLLWFLTIQIWKEAEKKNPLWRLRIFQKSNQGNVKSTKDFFSSFQTKSLPVASCGVSGSKNFKYLSNLNNILQNFAWIYKFTHLRKRFIKHFLNFVLLSVKNSTLKNVCFLTIKCVYFLHVFYLLMLK